MNIHFVQPTNSEYYTSDSEQETLVPTVAQNCLNLGLAFARKHYPEAEVTGALVPETLSAGNRSACDAEDGEGVLEHIEAYVGSHFCEEALWSPEFDAEAYLAANPR